MRYISYWIVFSGFIFSGCKKDKATGAVPKLKKTITVEVFAPTDVDTSFYTYNANGNVAEITHSFYQQREVFTYSGNTVTWTIYNSAGAVSSTSVYYLNNAGYADSLYYNSGSSTYSFKYDANGFKIEERSYLSTGDLSSVETFVNDSKNTTTGYKQFTGSSVSTTNYLYDLEHNNTLENANKGQSFLGKLSTNANKYIGVTMGYDTEGRIVNTYRVSGGNLLTNSYEYY